MEPNEQKQEEMYAPEAIDDMRAKIKQELIEEFKQRRNNRPPYLVPTSKFTRAEFIIKLVKAGYTLGLHIPKDIMLAMKLRRGQMLKCTLEMYPEDAARLYNDSLNVSPTEIIENAQK